MVSVGSFQNRINKMNASAKLSQTTAGAQRHVEVVLHMDRNNPTWTLHWANHLVSSDHLDHDDFCLSNREDIQHQSTFTHNSNGLQDYVKGVSQRNTTRICNYLWSLWPITNPRCYKECRSVIRSVTLSSISCQAGVKAYMIYRSFIHTDKVYMNSFNSSFFSFYVFVSPSWWIAQGSVLSFRLQGHDNKRPSAPFQLASSILLN